MLRATAAEIEEKLKPVPGVKDLKRSLQVEVHTSR